MKQCPQCEAEGRSVSRTTLEAQVVPARFTAITDAEAWALCLTASCEVVYFHDEQAVKMGETRALPFHKATDAQRLVCFCFEHSVAEVEADVAAHAASTMQSSIKQRCRAGEDDCGGPAWPGTRPTVVPGNRSVADGDITDRGHIERGGRGDSNVPIYRTGSEIVPLGNLDVGMNCLEHQTGAVLDIDGDGRNEALVSVPGASPDQGALFWIRSDGVDFVSAPFSVCTGDCQQGTALSVGLDRNGDGLGDVAVGAPGRTWITSAYGPAVGARNLQHSMRSGLFTHSGLAL